MRKLLLVGLGVVVCLVSSALVCSDVRAHTLEGPEIVQADEFGAFSYTVTLIAGPGSATLAAYTITPGENVSGPPIVADYGCNVVIDEGEEFSVGVAGTLIDPELPGTVTFEISFCGGGALDLITTIQPPSGVPATSVFGTLLLLLTVLSTGVYLSRRQAAS